MTVPDGVRGVGRRTSPRVMRRPAAARRRRGNLRRVEAPLRTAATSAPVLAYDAEDDAVDVALRVEARVGAEGARARRPAPAICGPRVSLAKMARASRFATATAEPGQQRERVGVEVEVRRRRRARALAAERATAARAEPEQPPHVPIVRCHRRHHGAGYDPRTLKNRVMRFISSNAMTRGRSVKCPAMST